MCDHSDYFTFSFKILFSILLTLLTQQPALDTLLGIHNHFFSISKLFSILIIFISEATIDGNK